MAKSKNIKEALSGHLLKIDTLDAVRLGLITPDSISELYRNSKEKVKRPNENNNCRLA